MKANVKTKKIISTVVNVIVILIAIVILAIAISSIASIEKGYNSMFGYAQVAVRTGSMTGTNADSFNEGDLLFVKILTEEEQLSLKVGDVITFRAFIEGKEELNTHRIIDVNEIKDADGKIINKSYVTKGDNAPRDTVAVYYSNVIGKYTGSRIAGVGGAIIFVQSSTGFLVLVVVPSILLLIYALVRLIISILAVKKEKSANKVEAITSQITEEEREKIKAQLLEEIKKEQQSGILPE